MSKEQLLDSTWSVAVSNDPKHRPQVRDFSEIIPDLSAIETKLREKRYLQWCNLLFETLRHPSTTLRYGVSAKVLGESIYDKSSGKVFISGIKNE